MQTPDPGKPNRKLDQNRDWVKYSAIGFQMVAVICAFVFAGTWLDERFATGSTWTLVLSLTGVGAGLYVALRDFI
ncbi:AtpZ/AtpI family protein [Neolewinella antarctica]|uniref:F0F1-type ATP synthase assembly protein I n=1 Tax=Neolewinella antarctica TaxID=442734 RepID=A0ABX0XAD5_9BACT|nr:AtpZ/AtpI family protein [Neolewinella antarctica]NJC25918.1 F0F1-type ATP synthase assembly protein I [Neolewinella antarctica]